jgi:ABC-type multidrug transport system ATPase subunit
MSAQPFPEPGTRITHEAVFRGARQLLKRRKPVLHAQTLDLPKRGVVGVVGINGAGKSTLLLELAGLLAGPRGPAAFAPQRPAFPAWLKSSAIAAMFGIVYEEMERAYPAMALGEMRDSYGNALSVGQAQALSLALALHAHAPMTLLDEPFAPLDFRRRVALSGLLNECRKDADRLILISSQSASELLDVCEWIVVLRRGTYEFSGPIAWLTDDATGAAARDMLETRLMSML